MSSWVKVYNSMPAHPKLLMAGDRASWLFVCGLCYSNEHLTDGFIARHALPVVAPGVKGPEKLAAALVSSGLWHVEPGGWRIHDYDTVQRSSDKIREDRARDRERKSDNRTVSNGSPRGKISDSEKIPDECPPGVRPLRVEESRGEKKKDNSTVEQGSTGEARQVFDAWIESTGRTSRTVFDNKRRRVIVRALKTHPLDDLLDAVRGWRHSPHHRGENQTATVYNEIELLLRDAQHIEKFRDLERSAGTRSGQVVPINRPAALENADRWKRHYGEESA